MGSILACIVLFWGATQKCPLLHRRDFVYKEDCFVRGWDFETRLILPVLAILVGGVTLALIMYDGAALEIIESQNPPAWVIPVLLILIVGGMVVIRRAARATYLPSIRKETIGDVTNEMGG